MHIFQLGLGTCESEHNNLGGPFNLRSIRTMQPASEQAPQNLRFPVRDRIQKLGLLTFVRNVRGLIRRDVANWVGSGCPSPAPNIVKMNVVKHYVRAYGVRTFIETGTYLGSMLEYIATTGAQCHSVEIDPVIYDRAKSILSRHKNIILHLGDSGVVIPNLLSTLNEPAVFWLDAHYSGSFTGKSEVDTPVSAELDMILSHSIKNHVILIDDARDFNGSNNYPKISDVLKYFDDHDHYKAMVSADIIRITPR